MHGKVIDCAARGQASFSDSSHRGRGIARFCPRRALLPKKENSKHRPRNKSTRGARGGIKTKARGRNDVLYARPLFSSSQYILFAFPQLLLPNSEMPLPRHQGAPLSPRVNNLLAHYPVATVPRILEEKKRGRNSRGMSADFFAPP